MRVNSNYEYLKAALSEHGVKLTSQRLAVYNALEAHKDHPSAEQLFQSIQAANPTISLGTVYKTLDTLSELGIINRVKSSEGQYRFDARKEPHYHVHCRKTKQIIDFEDTGLRKLVEHYVQNKGIENFKIKDIQVHITGEMVDEDKEIRFDN